MSTRGSVCQFALVGESGKKQWTLWPPTRTRKRTRTHTGRNVDAQKMIDVHACQRVLAHLKVNRREVVVVHHSEALAVDVRLSLWARVEQLDCLSVISAGDLLP